MKPVYTAKEIQAHFAAGKTEADLPASAVLTPSARDAIREHGGRGGPARAAVSAAAPSSGKPPAVANLAPVVPDYEYSWIPGGDPQTPQAMAAFFSSPEIQVLKERMCDMGRRIWAKNYVDGNGGNMTIRVGDNLVLCTPTLISKGYMKPEDICLVDFEGNQLAGTRKRTSEVNTHIGIMKRQPKAKSCCHAHPPHATAFAVAGMAPPSCMIPEAEVFLGKIGLAGYETPGSEANANVVGEIGVDHQAIIMENHGVITWGKDIEDAYWKMENTDAYCLTIWMASQIGSGTKTIKPDKMRELIGIRQSLGMDDKRAGLKEAELCDCADIRPGSCCSAPGGAAKVPGLGADGEAAVKMITDQIMKQMGS